MKPTVSVKGGQNLMQRVKELKKKIGGGMAVYVGVPASAGSSESDENENENENENAQLAEGSNENEKESTPLVVIAAVHEFGSKDGHIPERSFLRVPLRSEAKTFSEIWRRQMPRVIKEEITINQLFEQLGAKAVSVCQEAITAGIDPANAESTIKAKGPGIPLVNNGRLRQSITYEVRDES